MFGMTDPLVLSLGPDAAARSSACRDCSSRWRLSYTGGLQGTGDTRSPLYISIVSQVVLPLGLCTVFQAPRGLQATDIWLAIVLGHFTRCALSVARFRQQKWRDIAWISNRPTRPDLEEAAARTVRGANCQPICQRPWRSS